MMSKYKKAIPVLFLLISSMLLLNYACKQDNTGLVEPQKIENMELGKASLIDKLEQEESWTTPDSIYTWATPDSTYLIVDLKTIKKYAKKSKNGTGAIRLRKLKAEDNEKVFFELVHYVMDASNKEENNNSIESKKYIKWNKVSKQKKSSSLDEILNYLSNTNSSTLAKGNPTNEIFRSCPDWSGSPRMNIGWYYDLYKWEGNRWTRDFPCGFWLPWCGDWDLGSTYFYVSNLAVHGVDNWMSSLYGTFKYRTEACGNDVYRRFILTRKMNFFKNYNFSDRGVQINWGITLSSGPPYFILPDFMDTFFAKWMTTGYDDYSNKVSSLTVLVETFEEQI